MAYLPQRGGLASEGGREGIAKRIARGKGRRRREPRFMGAKTFCAKLLPFHLSGLRPLDRPTAAPPTDRPFQGGAKQSHLVTDPLSLPPFYSGREV